MLDLADVEPGDVADARLAVRASRGVKPYADGFLLTLTLGNATGSIPAKLWLGPDEERAREVADRLDIGAVLDVHARATEYRGRVELSLEDPPDTVPPDEVDPARFVPGSDRHLGRLLRAVLERARAIEDPGLREVVLAAWADDERQRALVEAPATKRDHRARRGGLLERAHDLVAVADALARVHAGLDADLLAAAALLAPLGGLDEHATGTAIEITDAGRLLGPVALADERLAELLEDADLDDERALRLRHAVLAHRGKSEASPVAPRTPEAVALRALERADARVARTLGAAASMREDGEATGWPSGTNGYLDVAARKPTSGPPEPRAAAAGTNGGAST